MDGTAVLKHHLKHELCTTRPAYREGRDLKAVKVYSVAQESQYLLVQGVPAVGASAELIKLFALYGEILEYRILDQYPTDDNYTEIYWIKYKKIQSARFAKKKLDDYAFFGGALHICYAPEYESVQETKDKLRERRREVAVRLRKLKEASSSQSSLVSETAAGHSSSIPQTIATDTAPGSSRPGLDNTGHQHWSDTGHQHISNSGQRPRTDHHHHQHHTQKQQDLQHETPMYNTPPPPPPP
ncbi:RNA-binding protein 48-like, partial [Lingula anatina]|uniref:RNA-binding protein 48 n=1 Tax=Lingula anatina TaxID=7574 RepID=A0A2R2MKL5_LINAN